MTQKLKVSLCEFKDGTFELYLIDPDNGEEVVICGERKFNPLEAEFLARVMPPCTFTTYEQIETKRYT